MTERERLIEYLKRIGYVFDDNRMLVGDPVEYVVNYLLDNGVIVPPCKVGDTVYIVDETSNEETGIDEAKVTEICYNGVFVYFDIDKDTYKYSAGQIGKKVFLTKEEAEKALEGMK